MGICDSARVQASERPLILDEEERPLILQNPSHSPLLTTFRLHPILIQAETNTWSRKERRKQQQQQQQPHQIIGEQQHSDGSTTPQTQQQPQLICSLQWSFDFTATPANVILESQWVFGDDRNMFEGLVSHIVKKMVQVLEPHSTRPWDPPPPTATTGNPTFAGARRD